MRNPVVFPEGTARVLAPPAREGVDAVLFILWFLQAVLIVLELHLVTRQVAGQELVALIRSWSGPALVLMVWVGGCGSLLRSTAEQENPQATALESTPVLAESQDGYRYQYRANFDLKKQWIT